MLSRLAKLPQIILSVALSCIIYRAEAQGLSINPAGTPADASAMLDINATDKGMLIPRMTMTQRDAITAPATGLMVFQTDNTPGFYYYSGSGWTQVGVGGGSLPSGTEGQVLKMVGGVPTWVNTLPTLTTTAVSSITGSGAAGGGNITSDGGAAVTARGVCWNTSPNPTISLTTKTTDGTGQGTFTSALTGLTKGGLYYVRAYATNSAGTAYGDEVTFTTPLPAATVTITSWNFDYVDTIVDISGNVADDGTGIITANGFCWGTSANPTVETSARIVTGAGTGSMGYAITGLSYNTTYHVRAYATYSGLTVYSTETVFTTAPVHPGESYAGGLYLRALQPYETDDYDPLVAHGIVVATTDQSTGIAWGCTGTTTGATDWQNGQTNTTAIVAACAESSYAAKLCDDLSLNGYDDWYLPCGNELNYAFYNVSQIASTFTSGVNYWTSTESGSNTAYYISTSGVYSSNKTTLYYVRAFRRF